jgi:hypothetical protein
VCTPVCRLTSDRQPSSPAGPHLRLQTSMGGRGCTAGCSQTLRMPTIGLFAAYAPAICEQEHRNCARLATDYSTHTARFFVCLTRCRVSGIQMPGRTAFGNDPALSSPSRDQQHRYLPFRDHQEWQGTILAQRPFRSSSLRQVRRQLQSMRICAVASHDRNHPVDQNGVAALNSCHCLPNVSA